MKKKILFAIVALALMLSFSLFACNIEVDNTADGIGNIIDNNVINNDTQTVISDKDDNISSDDLITDWESVGIFATDAPEYEFDFSAKDTNFSYKIGSQEDEELFARILSGEEDYRNYFLWFNMHPDYIYRYNEERYKVVAQIIQEGAFTQQLRDKYFGLYTNNATVPYFSALGITTESYQIYFKDDWSIEYIKKSVQYNIRCNAFELWHYSLLGYSFSRAEKVDGELIQYDESIEPLYDQQHLIGYKLTYAALLLNVDMGDEKTATCVVAVTYEPEAVTQSVWNGKKQKYEKVTFFSECIVTADVDNVYSGGFEMFDRVLLYAKQDGAWNLFEVWEHYREEALTPSLDLYETNEQKVYKLA